MRAEDSLDGKCGAINRYSMVKHLKWPYAIDPKGEGFFWPDAQQKRDEAKQGRRNSPVQFESVYQAAPGNRAGVIFLAEDFCYYDPPKYLDAGVADPEVRDLLEKGAFVMQAWDTAFSATSDSDFTVCVTGFVVPCDRFHRNEDPLILGDCDQHYDIYIVDVWREKVAWAEVVPAIRMQFNKWKPRMVYIEKKAYGASAIEALETSGIPITPVMPIEGKRSRAIEGVGAGSVQGWFRQHRVKFPRRADWLEALETEMKDFTGERGARDDQVDAMVHLVGAAIRDGASIGYIPEGWETTEQIDRHMLTDPGDTISPLFSVQDWTRESLEQHGLIIDPFDETCSRCVKYDAANSLCKLQGRKFSAITPACEMFEHKDRAFNFKEYK